MVVSLDTQAWRRPGCGDECARVLVLVIGERYKRVLEAHDPEAHEVYAASGRHPLLTQTGGLLIDHERYTAWLGASQIPLTPTEMAMLLCLARRIGTVCPKAHMLTAIWGAEYADEWHLLRVNIARLRAKLGPARDLIETRSAIGYTLIQVPPA